jgi:hypothetical protein
MHVNALVGYALRSIRGMRKLLGQWPTWQMKLK